MTTVVNDTRHAWYTRKWAQVFLHAVAWITLFSLPYLLRPSPDLRRGPDSDEQLWHIHFIVNAIFLTLFFYLNAGILIPKLFYRKKYLQFTGVLLLLFASHVYFRYLFVQAFITHKQFELKPTILFTFFTVLFMLACSTAWTMIRDKMNADKLASAKENENLKTELSLLRSQVSPHFMFNVLNNMVALARKHSDQLEPSLIKLSSLMRYMLYEADEDKVALEKETDYLQSYIDLQQQRFGAKVQVNVLMQLPEESYEIEPMLLIPFVENAFKHGTGLIPDARIDIELRAKQGLLQFSVMNKYNPEYNEIKDKTSGIGLTNVKRRLNLLYKDTHKLLINKENGWFVMSLQLKLH
ncbi:sensor histidine kinase [Chitinophaga rhizophila]|uniref:Histidine kinase n=1 Tax=Chitinophaga rhizophila TaxID=2866212 RepID=A0ABS7GLI4_9BACT|nr:histidine kinase [Chitinophaga rhizophila]MBW8687527.1 histidine kinase [Chitinophaga rhizophila]